MSINQQQIFFIEYIRLYVYVWEFVCVTVSHIMIRVSHKVIILYKTALVCVVCEFSLQVSLDTLKNWD